MRSIIYNLLRLITLMISKIVPSVRLISKEKSTGLVCDNYLEKPLWGKLEDLKSDSKDISFIIPVYNSEKFLAKCLNSIVSQRTSYEYEVICVNDGSHDKSGEILTRFAKEYPNLIVVVNQENQGISAARNRGIALARGKWVGFIDNDDFVKENYVEEIVRKARENNAGIVQVGYCRCTPEGEILARITHGRDFAINESNKNDLLKNVAGFIWGGAIRKDLFKLVRFPVGFWYEDMITRLVLMRECDRFEYIGECLYHYVVHQNNASKTVWKSGDMKSLDQYYLAKSLSEFTFEKMKLQKDEILYGVLLYELGTVLWLRTRKLGLKMQKAIFVLAADYMNSIRPKQVLYVENFYKGYDEAFRKSNFYKWLFLSISVMIGVKLRNGDK